MYVYTYIYIYIYICVSAGREGLSREYDLTANSQPGDTYSSYPTNKLWLSKMLPWPSPPFCSLSLSREFKDVVFEDVVVYNNILNIDVTISNHI